MERTIPISEMYETILLDSKIFNYKEKHNFLHLGCVQIALRHLTKEGLNASIMLLIQ